MDQNRIEGAATNIGGKVKDTVGGLIGDTKMQAGGKADQVSGQLQNAYGSAKDSASEAVSTLGTQIDGFIKDKPVMALLSAAGVGYVLARLTHRR